MSNVDHKEGLSYEKRAWDLGRRVDRLLLRLELAAQGPSVRYDRVVVSESPQRSQAPPEVDLSGDAWREVIEQLIVRIEERRPEWSSAELKKLVRLLAGHASGFVAHALSESVERVEQVRAAMGVDPVTGLSKERPLTAPVDTQIEVWERHEEERDWAFEAWETVYTPEAIYGLELDIDDAPKHGRWTATESHGVSARRYYEDRSAAALKKDATYPKIAPPFAGDPAGDWLAENDPRERLDGVSQELDRALAAEGLSLAEGRDAFRSSGGRPTAARQHVRQRVAAAIELLWEEHARRDLMAEALGCNRVTLWRLMSKPQRVSDK